MIDIGDILMKGDWVVMKRQPTLHRLSMMGFWVVPQDVKTFRVFLALTKPLNTEFDGDKSTATLLKIPWRQQK